MFRAAAATALVVLTAHLAGAQPGPQVLTVFPPGAKAGAAVEVTVAGAGFDGDEKLLFSGKGFAAERAGAAAVDPKAPKGAPAASVKFKVTAPSAPGTYDVRVVGKNGLSNPRTFVVGEPADVNEVEPNNDVPQAQAVDLDTTVNGVIAAPTDVDFVRVRAKAGQTVAVACLTTTIDSRMQADLLVTDADGTPLAANRGFRGGDAACDFKAPRDGEYLIRVSQFAYTTGGPDHFYRLTVSTRPRPEVTFPPVAAPTAPPLTTWSLAPTAASADLREPAAPGGHPLLAGSNPLTLDNGKNLTASDAQEVKLPCDVAGRIAGKGERHWYKFDAKKGDVWTLEAFAERIGSPVDAYFVLTDDKGKTIAEVDDGPDTLSPNQFYTKSDDPGRYRFLVPADGTYKVMVSTREAGVQFGPRNQFVLRIAREKPDFRLAVMPLTPHVPDAATVSKGGAVVLSVFAFRLDGFDGPIELTAENLPPGVSCPKQLLGAGQSRGFLVLACDAGAGDWEGFVKVVGTAGELKHAARPFTVTWPVQGQQANQPPPNVPMLARMDRGDGLALAVRGEAPFTLVPTETQLTGKPGGKIDVTLKVTRKEAFKDPIAIYSANPNFGPRPQGNQPQPVAGTAAPGAGEVKLSIDVPANTPPGVHALVFRAQGGGPAPKGGNNAAPRAYPNFAVTPIAVTVEGAPKKK